MSKRQGPARCLCSELVTVRWQDVFGRPQETIANLGEIWAEGATLEFEAPVRVGTTLQIECKGIDFQARVARCSADFIGCLVETSFLKGQRWSKETYEPQHFLDPRTLVTRDELRTKNHRLLQECARSIQQYTA